MDPVCNILGIDKVDADGKLILIEERHNSNANFVLNSVILNALNKNYGICFTLFHNTFHHYHNVGMKFGYNLTVLRAEGKVRVIEPMKIMESKMRSRNDERTYDIRGIDVNVMSNINNDINDSLFGTITYEYHELKKSHKHTIIVIDDLSHLYNLGFTLKDSMSYVRFLRSLIECDSVSQLCIVMHTYEYELQNSTANRALRILKHMAHLFIIIDSFKTGHSSDVSGKIIINWRVNHIRKKHKWSEISKYMYKLSDRQVKIYSPGH